MQRTNRNSTEHILVRNVDKVIERAHLAQALKSGRKLRVKLGIDPTTPDLHLGHAVVLWKLREFQDAGHTVVLIIGDYTAQIGDPSGKTRTRPALTAAEVERNMRTYLAQAALVLDTKKVETRYNSEWLGKLDGKALVRLLGFLTAQQLLERDDFAKRMAANRPLYLHELLYPVMQGYDSVAVKSDVECGGTDQLFNLLVGRTLMERMGLPPQDVLTVPLLEGLDGVRKMSKSLMNYVALTDAPPDMFGKIMSVPDALVERYFTLCTECAPEQIAAYTKTLKPKELKMRLGFEIVKRYHGGAAAEKASASFDRVFSKGEAPEGELPTLVLKGGEKEPALRAVRLPALEIVLATKSVASKSGARRLIVQGGFSVNTDVKRDPVEFVFVRQGDVVKIGKHRFFRVKL